MFNSIVKDYSIVRGVLRSTDLGYIAFGHDALLKDKEEHSLFLVYHQGNWIWPTNEDRSEWTTTSATVVSTPKAQALYMGLYGEIFRVGSGDVSHELALHQLPEGPASFGPMRCIRAIGGRAYAVGMGRQAYRRIDADRWERIDRDCRTALDLNHTHSFESVHGLSETAMLAAGRRGEIWSYDGSRWRQEDSPTNKVLTDVLVCSSGAALACGVDGVLLERTQAGWQLVEHELTFDDFWSLCEFSGRVFLSTMNGLYEFAGGTLLPVDFGADRPATTFCLSAAGDAMWSVGAKNIFSFDGAAWRRIV